MDHPDYTFLESQFQLDPETVFLNHGSFGACPVPVFNTYQDWQRLLEKQPVHFFEHVWDDAIRKARTDLGSLVGCQANDLVFFPNPTTALNAVIRSLKLQPGDEILTTDHEYGALNRTWKFYCERSGAKYINRKIPVPLSTKQEFEDHFLAGITPRTKIIFISQITSLTGLILPIDKICRIAREHGILTIIDGAHVPGHINLNISELDPDVYSGACHKWLCAPKGSSFLYVKNNLKDTIDPLVVSWGWESEKPGESQFLDYHQWQGTRDMSAFLTVPAAIQFQKENNWPDVRLRCHLLTLQTRNKINALTGLDSICPDSPEWIGQMASIRFPVKDWQKAKAVLVDSKIEIPVITWNNEIFIRVSVQAYNSEAQLDYLVDCVKTILESGI